MLRTNERGIKKLNWKKNRKNYINISEKLKISLKNCEKIILKKS